MDSIWGVTNVQADVPLQFAPARELILAGEFGIDLVHESLAVVEKGYVIHVNYQMNGAAIASECEQASVMG